MAIWTVRNRMHALATVPLTCRNGHHAAHRLARRSRRLTVFGLAVLPIGRSHLTVCTQCGEALVVEPTQAAHLLGRPLPAPRTPLGTEQTPQRPRR